MVIMEKKLRPFVHEELFYCNCFPLFDIRFFQHHNVLHYFLKGNFQSKE